MIDTALREEHLQATARLVVSLCVVGALIVIMVAGVNDAGHRLLTGLAVVAGYGVFAAAWLFYVRRHPQRWLWRRYITIILDMVVVTATMHLVGRYGAYFYMLYLWVIVGNGLRFGPRHLSFGIVCGLAGFGSLVLFSPFWRAQPEIALGLALGILILPLFYLSILRRLKRLNTRLAEQLEKARVAERAKGDFLANMSHEIRTPLNGILGVAEIMRDGELSAEQSENLDVVSRSGESLLNIINDILDFSKIASGRMTCELIPFNLEQVIMDVFRLLRGTANEKGIALTLEIPSSLPRSYLGDPTRIRQILFNLVGNAIKFTEVGEVAVAVGLAGSEEHPVVVLSVRDTGIGIPADRLSAIFDQFEQADTSTTRRFGGTGLGLAICRELAQLMGGEIVATSTEGEGSLFRVELPLAEAEIAVAQHAVVVEQPQFDLHVLVAEDNPVNQFVLRRQLQRLGISCLMVEDGQQAVAALDESIDLVFLDVRMPIMSGLEAATIIRQREDRLGRIPLCALTADAGTEDVARSLAAGMNAHLSKPLKTEDLVQTLVTTLGFLPGEAVVRA